MKRKWTRLARAVADCTSKIVRERKSTNQMDERMKRKKVRRVKRWKTGSKTESRQGGRAQVGKSGEKVRAWERMAAQVEEGRKGKERKQFYDMEEMG